MISWNDAVWFNEKSGGYLVLEKRITHTGDHTTVSETWEIEKASLLPCPPFRIRRSKKYVRIPVIVERTISKMEVEE